MPPVILPQTPDQARQRDHHAGLDTGLPENPAHELARLRNAIRLHRAEIAKAGELKLCEECATGHDTILHAKHQADEALWGFVPLQGQV